MTTASADPLAAAGGLVGALLDVALLRLRCSLLGRPPRFGLDALVTSSCPGRGTGRRRAIAELRRGAGSPGRRGPGPGSVPVVPEVLGVPVGVGADRVELVVEHDAGEGREGALPDEV